MINQGKNDPLNVRYRCKTCFQEYILLPEDKPETCFVCDGKDIIPVWGN